MMFMDSASLRSPKREMLKEATLKIFQAKWAWSFLALRDGMPVYHSFSLACRLLTTLMPHSSLVLKRLVKPKLQQLLLPWPLRQLHLEILFCTSKMLYHFCICCLNPQFPLCLTHKRLKHFLSNQVHQQNHQMLS